MSQDIEKNINQIKELLSGGNSSENVKSLLGSLLKQNESSDSRKDKEGETSGSGPAFDADTLQMFFKIKQIMDSSQKNNDPREKLLNALKPYLSDKRKDKLAECMQILKITNIIDIFSNLEGGKKEDGKQKH